MPSVDLQSLVEERGKGMDPLHKEICDKADKHSYGCSCDICLRWWALMGPDGGEPGNYGPFIQAQVNEMQRSMGLMVTE